MALAGAPATSSIGEVVADLEISAAWLVDPVSGREGPGEIVVTDGVLESVVWLDDEEEVASTTGVVVAPGFIDLHAHFREPGNEDAETVASGLAAAAHGGFTTVCLMPNTTPALDDPAVLSRVEAAAGASGSPVRALAYGAVSAGRASETLAALGELADAGVVGFSDDGSPIRSARSCATRSPMPARSGCRSSTTPRTRRLPPGPKRTTGSSPRFWACAAGRPRPRRQRSRGTWRSSPRSSVTCPAPGST